MFWLPGDLDAHNKLDGLSQCQHQQPQVPSPKRVNRKGRTAGYLARVEHQALALVGGRLLLLLAPAASDTRPQFFRHRHLTSTALSGEWPIVKGRLDK